MRVGRPYLPPTHRTTQYQPHLGPWQLTSSLFGKAGFSSLVGEWLLPLGSLLLDVIFHSFRCHTGWGHRQLNSKEIASAMDLPLWYSTSPVFLGWLDRHARGQTAMPLKPFQSILNSVFVEDVSSIPPDPVLLPHTNIDSLSRASEDFWIEPLRVVIPGSWVTAGEVWDKAAKSDDAQIHTGLWDQCIIIVLPAFSTKDIESLRPLFYQVWCETLVGCYKRFMFVTHGTGWEHGLFKLRCLRRLGANVVQSQRGGVNNFIFTTQIFPLYREMTKL